MDSPLPSDDLPEDESVQSMLHRTVFALDQATTAANPPTPWLWEIAFVDADSSDVVVSATGVPRVSPTWRAVAVAGIATYDDPAFGLSEWELSPESVGVVLSWVEPTYGSTRRMTAAVLRDGTVSICARPEGGAAVMWLPNGTPSYALQALRRTLGLPSGLPEPQPAVLVARMHAAVLESVAALPDDKIPTASLFLQLVRDNDPDAADRIAALDVQWRAAGLTDAACRRGVVIASLAEYPVASAALVKHPALAPLAPLVSEVDGWKLVLRRLRATPPAVGVPASWWQWADDAMVAELISATIPAPGSVIDVTELVAAGALPADAARVAAESVARLVRRQPCSE